MFKKNRSLLTLLCHEILLTVTKQLKNTDENNVQIKNNFKIKNSLMLKLIKLQRSKMVLVGSF